MFTAAGPRGTKDMLPDASGCWQYVEKTAAQVCARYGYREIRTPIFEHTELFLRGIGETTDIVEKEMYTFTDRGDRSITLRPENTAAVVRAFLEHKLYAGTPPLKVFYIGPMFRYDRPQAGRFRQFHQFGIEAIGAGGAAIDAEVIVLATDFLKSLGLTELSLQLNSVGCPTCRPQYRTLLQDFLRSALPDLCGDCQSRFERNPLRVLDCKNQTCTRLTQGAPQMTDCLCDSCSSHFTQLKELLSAAGLTFTLNPRLVRGLDYYTKTAFEIQYAPLGAQSAVCGGGRYDGLVAECGGQSTPAIGFAIGLERVLLALEKQGLLPDSVQAPAVFVLAAGQAALPTAFQTLCCLRAAGLTADMDFMERSLKAQMKLANKLAVKFAVIIGEQELETGSVILKNMTTGDQQSVIINELVNKLLNEVKD